MQTIQQEVFIPQNHQLNFSVDVPVNIPTGNTEIMLVFNSKIDKIKGKKERTFGQLKGKIKIPDDFNDENEEINKMFYGEV